MAVYGGPMGLAEMRRINMAERVMNTYRAMMKGDMTKWAAANPRDYEFITIAIRLYEQRKPKVIKRAHRKH